jgi:hypothetical protein
LWKKQFEFGYIGESNKLVMTKEDAEVICEYLKKRYDELEEERKAREEECKLKQKYCNHIWGPVTWTWCCGGYRTCKICGAREDYYERD